MFIKRTLDRFNETSSSKDRPITGRSRTARTPKMCRNIREKIRRFPRRSMRKMAKQVQISERSIRSICRDNLGMTPYKIQEIQLLSAATIQKRLERSKELLNSIKGIDLLHFAKIRKKIEICFICLNISREQCG